MAYAHYALKENKKNKNKTKKPQTKKITLAKND